MRVSTAVCCLALGGCAQLAGIDNTSGDGLVGVSLSVERISIGSTVVRAPQDLSANTAVYLVPDPVDPNVTNRVTAEQTEVGLWTADIFDATPPVLFDLPEPAGPVPILWDFPNQDLLAGFGQFEHPDPVVSDPDAMLSVNVALDRMVTAETFELFVIGTWTRIGLPAPLATATTLAPPAFAVSTMGALTGRPVEQITPDDSVLILRRTANRLDGVLEVPAFAQTGNDALAGTMVPVATDQSTLDIRIDPMAAATRFSAARPALPTTSFAWSLVAAPGANETAHHLGPLLDSAGITMADSVVQTTYGNPFAAKGWPSVLTWAAGASRTVMLDGTTPVILRAGMAQVIAEPIAGQVLDFPAGFPQLISINGQALSIDNDVTLPAQTTPFAVTVVTDRGGATLFTLDVFELVLDSAGTAFELHRVMSAAGLQPTFKIPPETLVGGKRYTLRVQSVNGSFPNAAIGDLRARSLPLATAFLDSGVFQVAP